MTSKYIKFGLRADKNLADLESPSQALANVLDNNSSALDENGNPSGFTVADISATQGLRNTGLADFTNENGQSTDLAGLNGSLVSFTNIAGSNQLVEPLVTLQDNISNFKSVLGNPPWINGGDGLVCNFIPSDRIKTNPTSSTKGNTSNATTLGGLASDELFTSYEEGDFDPIIGPLDFWNNGVFEFSAKLHPQMRNTYGLVQWTAYLASNFEQDWGSTGLFMIEEDTVDDGTENNWTTIKSVYNASQSISGLVFGAVSGGTVTLDFSGASDTTYICQGMKFVHSSVTYEIASVDANNKTAVIETSTTITGTTKTFTWSLGEDEIRSDIKFTAQKKGSRVRVRFTTWYPDPGDGSAYRDKRFFETNENSERAPFSDFYKTFDRDQVFGPYTYKYFEDNKASALNQTSSSKLTVLNTLSLPLDPPETLNDKVIGMSGASSTTVSTKTITVRDNFGKISAANFSGVSVGDWMVFQKTSNTTPYAFQILEISGSDEDGNPFAFIKDTLNADASVSIGDTQNAVFFKNVGLVGIFRLDSAGGNTGSLYQLAPSSINPNPDSKVFPDQIIMTLKADGTGGLLPKRLFEVSGTNPRVLGIANHLSNAGGTNFVAGNYQYGAVYASRGLDDKSSYLQCDGVYGREVASDASTGATSIVLTTAAGVSTNDFVQFDGAVSGNNTTTVQSINGNTVTISPGLIGPLPAARTLIFVKSGNNPGNTNKEFCVIPLNTAPPFAGTAAGLKTPATNKNLTVAGLKFGSLEVTLPTGNLTDIATPPANSQKNFRITYGSTTYKMLAV
jgi:hypothetical protein